MTTRAERAAEARRLRGMGLLHREVAARMGISASYAGELLDDPTGEKVRARKKSYRGTCLDCGASTDGSNGRTGAPDYCHACVPKYLGAAQTIWTRDVIVARIQEWAAIHGEPPAVPDWNPQHARHAIHDESRARRFETDVRWPWFTSVVYAFGSWNAAIEAAGFKPRRAGGFKENHAHRRKRQAAA